GGGGQSSHKPDRAAPAEQVSIRRPPSKASSTGAAQKSPHPICTAILPAVILRSRSRTWLRAVLRLCHGGPALWPRNGPGARRSGKILAGHASEQTAPSGRRGRRRRRKG